ncbi:MAG: thiamine diphosphokinase [Bacilli bacterium]
MKKLNIFLGNQIFEPLDGDILAVDVFGINLINAGYRNFVSIGDFDSCSDKDFELLKNYSKLIKFPVEKDEGDLELAFIYAMEHKYTDVVVYNINCGKRLDHLLNNIFILKKYKNYFNLIIKDQNNIMYFLSSRTTIEKNKFSYISLMFFENTIGLNITTDFKYSFNGNVEKFNTSFISNELKNNSGTITFESGEVFLIQSKD